MISIYALSIIKLYAYRCDRWYSLMNEFESRKFLTQNKTEKLKIGIR